MLEQLPAEVLRKIDAHQLSGLTSLLVDETTQALRMEADPSDLKTRRVYLGIIQAISRASAQFGLSPSDRQRLKIATEEPKDSADEWLEEVMGRRN